MAKESRKNSQEERRSSRSRSQDRNSERSDESQMNMQASRGGQAEESEAESWNRNPGEHWNEGSRGEAGGGNRSAGGSSGGSRIQGSSAGEAQPSGRNMQRYGGGQANRADMQRHGQQSPFAFMRRFSEDMDRLFEDFWGGGGLTQRSGFSGLMGGFGEGFWAPQVEVLERDGQLHVRADLPGINKDEVEIECDEDSITIRGERHQEHEENEEGLYHSERSYGSFMRTIPLPEGVDTSKAQAHFEDGVLEITMPAPQRLERGRRIAIQSGQGTGEGQRPTKGAGRETRENERGERERSA